MMTARHSGIDIRHAIDSGSIDAIRQWSVDGDVNRTRVEQMPLIHYACRVGQPASVRALHEAGSDPNRLDSAGMTAMDVATWFGEVRNGMYTPQSLEIVAFLASVGGRHARWEDVPFWRRSLGSYFRRPRQVASASTHRYGYENWNGASPEGGTHRRVRAARHPNEPDLPKAARAAGEAARRVAAAAVERAISDNGVAVREVTVAIECLRRDDLPGALAQRDALQQALERLDSEYFAVAAAEPRDEEAVLRAFRRARAVNAVCAALAADPVAATIDAIYEAYYALPEDRADVFLDDMTERLRGRTTSPASRGE